MGTSIVNLCQTDQALARHQEVFYPQNGAEQLFKVEKNHFWFSVRRNLVLDIIRALPSAPDGSLIGLDIGCGTGYTAAYMSALGYPTYGVDAYDSFREIKAQNLAAGFIRGDILSLEPEAEFDFLLLLDVIEHIKDDSIFLKQSLKFLKPGGVAIITVPAFQCLWSKVDEYSQHQRRYSKKSMALLINEMGPSVSLEWSRYFYGTTILPFIVSRIRSKPVQNTIQDEAMPPAPVNLSLKALLQIERFFCFRLGGLPFGSSLFALVKKLNQ